MKHVFTSAIADSADTTLVRPVNWNDNHVMGVTVTAVDLTLAATNDFIKCTGGVSGIMITLPSSPRTGQQYTIKKVDTGVGEVTVVGTIDGDTNYGLISEGQYVVVVWDGSAWNIIGNN